MPTPVPPVALRQCVLAVSVLADVDLVPDDNGVVVPGSPDGRSAGQESQEATPLHVTWAEVAETLGGLDPMSSAGRLRVTTLLQLYRLVADHARRAEDVAPKLRNAARALALPADHPLHAGPGWVRQRLQGGALDLGVGLLGLGGDPDDVQPLPPSLARRLDLRPELWWPDLDDHVERMGGLAATRISRDGRPVLRPVGGCDALTLLASSALREHLATGDGTGMRAVAAPNRRRAWFDLAQIDPAYTAAVWSITEEAERGLPTPLLVTRHEVVLVDPGPGMIATSLGHPLPHPGNGGAPT